MDIDSFAQRLRSLRLQAGLTQEALAARLAVSAQAVSKWENGANLPETALILPLARLLGVSADGLLAEPAPRKEWEARWEEARKRRDHRALLRISEAALEDWPRDRDFRFRRGNEEYQVAALTEDASERTRLLRAAEEHLSELLRDRPGNEDAGTALVQILLVLGKGEEAEALAERLPHREKLQLLLRRGEARENALRREIAKTAVELLNLLQNEGSREACSLTAAILEAAEQPKSLIWYRLHLLLRRAGLAWAEGDADGALAALGELVKAAGAQGAPAQKREAPSFFAGLPEEAASPAELRRWVGEALADGRFTALHEHPVFAALEREAAALPG